MGKGGRGLQVALRGEIETLPAYENGVSIWKAVYAGTRMEIASLAGPGARLRFRLLQYLSCCKFDIPLIIQRGENGRAAYASFPFA